MLGDILQPTHLIILLAVVLLFLGPKRLPGAGRALGQGLREFKTSVTGGRSDDHQTNELSGTSEDETAGADTPN